MKVIDEICETIKGHHKFLVTSHVNPDGDAIGSELAFFCLLEKLGKEVRIVNEGHTPALYHFLPRAGLVEKGEDSLSSILAAPDFEVAFVLECPSILRAGKIARLLGDKTVINIDHHSDNERFGTINWVDSNVAATGEMIYELFNRLNCDVDKESALYLYTAILTDTGSFRYPNTRPRTHLIVAELMKRGVNPAWVSEHLYEVFPSSAIKLLSLALSTIELSEDGKVAWILVTRDMLKETGSELEESDGFVNYPRSVKGVKAALIFKELEAGLVKVSFRSKGEVKVGEIARFFGGGGHPQASGCTLKGELDRVVEKVVKKVKQSL